MSRLFEFIIHYHRNETNRRSKGYQYHIEYWTQITRNAYWVSDYDEFVATCNERACDDVCVNVSSSSSSCITVMLSGRRFLPKRKKIE